MGATLMKVFVLFYFVLFLLGSILGGTPFKKYYYPFIMTGFLKESSTLSLYADNELKGI